MTEHGMYVVHDGDRDAPPLLLIHGSGATSGLWQPIVPALAVRHHVIRVDLPGCGRSPVPRSYAVPDQAAQVAALLDELGLESVAVAGHSSGGYVATALAERRPELVGSLALISSGPALDALLPQPALLKALLAPPLGRVVYALRTDGMTRKALASTAARPIVVPDDVIAEQRGTTFAAFQAISAANTEYLVERSVPDRLAALDRPVLILFGTADRRWDPASGHRFDAVPKAKVVWLEGVGHLAMFEAPDVTAAKMLAFVE